MKIKNKALILLIMLMFTVLLFPLASSTTYAAGDQVLSTDIDSNLFAKLSNVRGTNYLTTESFNSVKYETISLKGAGTVNTDSNIEDITGLTKFKFEFTKSLDLSNNSITAITAEILSAFPKLEELIVSDNQLSSLDITGCYNLRRLIVDNNQLRSLDATDMYATDAEIDLSSNLIESVNDIILPSQTLNVSTTIKLYNNNISDYTGFGAGYTAHLGLQGIQTNEEDGNIEQKQDLIYYKTNDDQRLKVVITSNEVEKYSFVHSEMTEDKKVINLPNGNYEVSFYYINTDADETLVEASTKRHRNPASETFYETNTYLRYYKYKEFGVIPSTPEYVYVIDGEEYTHAEVSKIKKKSQIKLSADDDVKIYYQIGNLDWVEGNEISINQGGQYQIRIKAVSEDGNFESRTKTIYINAAANLNLPGILVLILVVLITVAIFGIGLPLLRKYVF